MGVKYLRRITVGLLCMVAIIGLFIELISCVYAADSTWPRIKKQDGFKFVDAEGGDTWSDSFAVADADGNVNWENLKFSSENITIDNYDELTTTYDGELTKNKVGRIVLDYGEKLVLQPTSGSYLLAPKQYFIDYEGDAVFASPYIFLKKGFVSDQVMFVASNDNSIRYTYDICAIGNNMVGTYPRDWLFDENNDSFTIKSDHHISDYKAYSILNKLVPTWGTKIDKDFVDFSNGSDTFTLTNAIGESKTYTIKVDMPWKLSLQGKSGYNLVSIRVEGETVVGAMSLSKYIGTVDAETISGKKVDFTISPYGDNEGKIIDSIVLIMDDGTEIESNVNGNTVSFEMPEGNVRIGSISYKDAEMPLYSINACASDYVSSKQMGTVSIIVNDAAAVSANSGDIVSLIATPIEHTVYKFDFSHWETTDIELSEEQRISDTISFVMPEKSIRLTAVFEKKGIPVIFVADPGDAVENVNTFQISELVSIISSTNGILASDLYKPGSKVSFAYTTVSSKYIYNTFVVTDQDGNEIPYEIGNWQNVVFTIPETGVTSINVVAKFKAKEFSSITAKANDASMGTVTATVNGSAVTAAVIQDETVTVNATPSARFKFVNWDLAYADGSAIDFELSDRTSNPATFVVPDNGKDIVVTGNFELDPEQMSTECYLLSAALYDGNTKYTAAKEGATFTITVPADLDVNAISNMVLKLTSSEYATIKKSGDTEDWPAEGKACGMVLDTPVTFTVTAEDGKTTQDYIVTLAGTKSSEKEITAVRLLDGAKNVIAQGALSGDTWTIELPSDIDPDLAGRIGSSTDVFMQIEYTGASLMQAGGYDDAGQASWNTGTILCGVSANSQKDFTVTAEDGSTKDYIIAISYSASDAPTISNGSVERTGENTAIVKFTSNQVGAYYYQLVEKGASADVDTNKNGSTALAGENTLHLSNLTADSRDVYIVVKNAAGAESIPYKLEIPDYEAQDPEPGSYTITIMTPKGGNLFTNITTANQGDSILVTVSPNSGYQMVEGSMTYTLAVAGGETVKITGNRFTMPDCDVTLTCRWEEAVVEEAGITSFVIMGVSGVISQSSDTEYNITLALPHGTDVTNLTPAISSNGNVTISPASGKAQDFSSPVTYTVTLEDGSKLAYKVSVYVSAGSKAERMWENITDITTKTPWWEYANELQKQGKYPKYW